MDIITQPRDDLPRSSERVKIQVERLTLSKRRWRGLADDGREFGFALNDPLQHGAVVHVQDGKSYVVEQQPEPVLVIGLPDAAEAARLGWMIGNLHFPLMVAEDALVTPDDEAIRQTLEREGIRYREDERVFIHSGRVAPHAH